MTSSALALIRPTDTELARGTQAGDEASLAILIQRHRPGMLAVALGVLGMGADAEDAVQDATLTAVRRIRAKLTTALRETADAAHADAGRLIAASRSEAIDLLAAADRGEYAAAVADRWAPETEFITDAGYLGGRDSMVSAINSELAVGTCGELVNAVASHDLIIWEMDIINPADRPGHCPSAVTWLLSLHEGRVRRLRLFHPRTG